MPHGASVAPAGVARTSFKGVADRASVHGAEALPLYVLVVFMDREVDVVMDIDTDDEEALGALGVADGGEPRAAQLPLHQFLRLIAGGRLVAPPAARSNDALLDALRRGGTLSDARVTRAMRLVRRDAFVPGAQRDEALVDAPIRLESLGFNISAPHMHAACLEALDLCPGHAFLDIGSGSGLVTAMGAALVAPDGELEAGEEEESAVAEGGGPEDGARSASQRESPRASPSPAAPLPAFLPRSVPGLLGSDPPPALPPGGGFAVGVDTRPAAIAHSQVAAKALASTSSAFARCLPRMRYERADAFTLGARHVGAYDRVCVGASCPSQHLRSLLRLLRPGAEGRIVVPVPPNDLRVVTLAPDGSVSQRVISQVRFSELEVPSDAAIVLARVAEERERGAAAGAGAGGEGARLGRREEDAWLRGEGSPPRPEAGVRDRPAPASVLGSMLSQQGAAADLPALSQLRVGGGGVAAGAAPLSSPLSPLPPLGASPSSVLGPCAAPAAASKRPFRRRADSEAPDLPSAAFPPSAAAFRPPAALGEPDCLLLGAGWSLPAHGAVLARSCEHIRALRASGMADAGARCVPLPAHFSRPAVAALVEHAYTGALPAGLEAAAAVGVVYAALYFCVPGLVAACEDLLCGVLEEGGGGGGRRARGAPLGRPSAAERPAEPLDQADRAGPRPEAAHAFRVDSAAALLALAHECGLARLLELSLAFVVDNFEEVRGTEAYAALPRAPSDLVARAACARLAAAMRTLREVASPEPLPEPSA